MTQTYTVDMKGLSSDTGIPTRTIQTLMRRRKIPFLKLGYRTLRFQPEKVKAALAKLEIKEVGAA
jgi:excisionase family DNA binding protein